MQNLIKNVRNDLPGIFNETFVLKKYFDRFNNVLENGECLPPYEVLIHLSSKCNLQCKWCIGANIPIKEKEDFARNLKNLPCNLTNPDNIEKLIKNILEYKKEVEVFDNGKRTKKIFKVENVSFSGIVGEPLVAKDSFIKAVDLLSENGIRIGMFSNATLIDEDIIERLLKMDYINISLDAGTPETYANLKFGGADYGKSVFNKLLENISKLVKAKNESKSKLKINASYILYPYNYKEIYDLAKILKNLGIDNFRMKQDNSGKSLLSVKQMEEANILLNKIDEIIDDNFKFIRIHKLNNPLEMKRAFKCCIITDLMASIGSDGNMYPCNYHPRVGGFSYGSVISNKFEDVWEGEERMKIRKMLPKICPKVCDPFKNRANRLFEEIMEYRNREGIEKYLGVVDKIIKETNS